MTHPDIRASGLPLGRRSIVCLSTIDWDFLWQGHQEMMSRFAAGGARVVYVENTGARSVRVSDLPRIARRLAHGVVEHVGAARTPVAGVRVVAPLVLPFPKVPLARLLNERVLLPRLAGRIRDLSGPPDVIFTILPTPDAVQLIRRLRGPACVLVYYCLADFQELSDLGRRIEDSERWIVRESDLVFVQTQDFARRFERENANIHEFQFGVNLDTFVHAPAPTPSSEVAALPRPIVGYSGGLHRHVDFELVAAVARARPDASVVLVGPPQTDPAGLRAIPNVHLLGARPFASLPGLLAAFDVAIIPYRRTAYTDTVFPTKLYEYLAMGLPVVSTALPELVKLGLPEHALRLVDGPQAFVTALNAAIADRGGEADRARAVLARERDWELIVGRMAELIAGAAEARHSRPHAARGPR